MTATRKVDLRGAAGTLLMTLYMRRLDALSRRPILGDPYAEEVYDRIEHDVHGLWRAAWDVPAIVCRSALLDDWTRRFLAAEPDGQVLHLGCGLDSRPLRVTPPPGCRWVDVDQLQVMAIRRRLYDLPPHVRQVAGSVTDDGWWAAIDPARTTLVVAEGLFMYLSGEALHTAVDRVTGGTPRGEIAFDAVAPWTLPVSRWTPLLRFMGTEFHSAWDPAGFAHRHPDLLERDDVSIYDEVTLREPRVWLRPLLSATGHVPAFQDSLRLHHFTYGR
ncbi:class I SAM-dependent methyltransferase [Pseudonocardia nantongensis]|uniref:class I SAM-dependent methyltransferase n=1 Tax=Pseudonocardia nantongensis TaxID=1181885 RepID=UPI00397CF8EE